MKTSEILDKAALYIEEHGWCQHTSVDESGRVCMFGAIDIVAPIQIAYADAIGAVYHHFPGLVSDWNDRPGRTKQDVLDRLRLVAQKERDAGR